MSDETQEEAAELAKRAGRQGRNAARNGIKAAKAVAEPVIDAAHDEAVDTVNKLEGTAEDAVQAARKINPNVLSRLTGDTGIGFLALSVSIWAGAVAFNQFRGVAKHAKAQATRPID